MPGVDIREIRRRNLKRLVESKFGNNVARFSRTVGRQPSFFNDLFAEPPRKKSFGEKLARGLERTLGLGAGSLDESPDGPRHPTALVRPPGWPFEIGYERFDRLSPDDKKVVEGAVLRTIQEIEDRRSSRGKSRRAAG